MIHMVVLLSDTLLSKENPIRSMPHCFYSSVSHLGLIGYLFNSYQTGDKCVNFELKRFANS